MNRTNEADSRWSVVTAGVDAAIQNLIARFCAAPQSRFTYLWSTSSPGGFAQRYASAPGDILVLDQAWPGSSIPQILTRIHEASCTTRIILLGTAPTTSVLAEIMPLGMRGCVPKDRTAFELPRAIEAITAGQVWLSRGQISELIDSGMCAQRRVPESMGWSVSELTSRELTVLREVLQGHANKEIARSLDISAQTVKVHLQHVYRKLHVRRRIDLLLLYERGLTSGARILPRSAQMDVQ